MSADRDRETRLVEAREEIARWLWQRTWLLIHGEEPNLQAWDDRPGKETWLRDADGLLALPALRAVGEGDRLRRDLAALAEELEANAEQVRPKPRPPVSPGVLQRFVPEPRGLSLGTYADNLEYFADRIRDLLDGGEGGR